MLSDHRKTLGLVLVAVALLAAWLAYVPYRPERVLRAIPANTQILTTHENLAARWSAILQNPLLQSIALSAGVETTALKTLTTDPETLRWVQRLAARNTALAYVPRLGAGGQPSWVLVSWLGGDSQWLRLQLSCFPPRGFDRHAPHNGVPYWTFRIAGLRSGTQLSLAFVEGLLIACVGEDPTAMLDLLDTSDGILPSLAVTRGAKLSDYWCLNPTAPDHSWIDAGAFVRRAPTAPPLTLSLSAIEPHYLEGDLCGAVSLPAAKTSAKPMDPGELVKLAGDLPMAAVLIRAEFALPPLAAWLGPEWAQTLDLALRMQGTDRVALFMMGGDYGGRLYGFRIPALVVAIPVRKSDAMPGLMQGLLDQLNLKHGWGLIPHESTLGNRSLHSIEGTTPNAFSALPPDERPAYALCDNWFLIASSQRTLAALLARYDRSESDNEAHNSRWASGLQLARGGAYGWVDFARARDELRLIIAGYSLKLMFEDPHKSATQRAQLNLYRAWLDTLAPLGEGKLWLTSDGQLSALRFEAGTPAQ